MDGDIFINDLVDVFVGDSTMERRQCVTDVAYVDNGVESQKLDIFLPAGLENPQLLVWVHGGAWCRGDKSDIPVKELLNKGYALASVNFRLSTEAKFPALIHDVKAALRYLRANEETYGYTAEDIILLGCSSGGHMAALCGVTNGHADLEGDLGIDLDVSSDVQGVVDFYGPTNFMSILQHSTPHGLNIRIPALNALLGDDRKTRPLLNMIASPVSHVDQSSVPLLIIHGDQDPQVPINQSHELHARYKEYGRPCELHVVHGGAHGGDRLYSDKVLSLVDEFIKATIGGQEAHKEL